MLPPTRHIDSRPSHEFEVRPLGDANKEGPHCGPFSLYPIGCFEPVGFDFRARCAHELFGGRKQISNLGIRSQAQGAKVSRVGHRDKWRAGEYA